MIGTGGVPSGDNLDEIENKIELVDLESKEGWLGEKDSNPHNQNQNLTSYP